MLTLWLRSVDFAVTVIFTVSILVLLNNHAKCHRLQLYTVVHYCQNEAQGPDSA